MQSRFNFLAIVIFTLFVSSTLSTAHADSRDTKNVYYLYGDPKPGTKFKQKLFKDVVPFDKTYSELSPELKARVKAAYGGLKETEHPPFPSEGTQSIYQPLYEANRGLRAEGDVLAIAMVGKDGVVKKVTVYKAPRQNVVTMLNYIISNTEFDPATCDGEPCEMEYLFENRLDVMPSIAR